MQLRARYLLTFFFPVTMAFGSTALVRSDCQPAFELIRESGTGSDEFSARQSARSAYDRRISQLDLQCREHSECHLHSSHFPLATCYKQYEHHWDCTISEEAQCTDH